MIFILIFCKYICIYIIYFIIFLKSVLSIECYDCIGDSENNCTEEEQEDRCKIQDGSCFSIKIKKFIYKSCSNGPVCEPMADAISTVFDVKGRTPYQMAWLDILDEDDADTCDSSSESCQYLETLKKHRLKRAADGKLLVSEKCFAELYKIVTKAPHLQPQLGARSEDTGKVLTNDFQCYECEDMDFCNYGHGSGTKIRTSLYLNQIFILIVLKI